jgi:hypothetical protein
MNRLDTITHYINSSEVFKVAATATIYNDPGRTRWPAVALSVP